MSLTQLNFSWRI